MDIPDYKIQPRDILYITIKAMTPEGRIMDYLSSGSLQVDSSQVESGGFQIGYDVKSGWEYNCSSGWKY